jgi:hypothetical protein
MSDSPHEKTDHCFVVHRCFTFVEATDLDAYDESGYDMKDEIKIIPFTNIQEAQMFVEYRNSPEFKAQQKQERLEKYHQKIAEITALNEKIKTDHEKKMNFRRQKGWKVSKVCPPLHKIPSLSRLYTECNCRESYSIIVPQPDNTYEISFTDMITNGVFGRHGPLKNNKLIYN